MAELALKEVQFILQECGGLNKYVMVKIGLKIKLMYAKYFGKWNSLKLVFKSMV